MGEVEDRYVEMYDGMVRRDASLLMEVLDDTFVLVHMTGMRQDRGRFIAAVLDGTLDYRSAEHVSVRARVSGDEAMLRGRSKVLAAVFGRGLHRWDLQLDLRLVRRDGVWRITEAVASTFRGDAMVRVATIYYSLKGETIAPGFKIVNLEKGHTQAAAEFVHAAVGGDLIGLETVKEYCPDHMRMIYEAKDEIENGIVPELRSYPDVSGYDVVFLGMPNWWDTVPTPVEGFLRRCDWTGKVVVPFVTSGGSGFGGIRGRLGELCRGADLLEGRAFLGHEVESSGDEISAWAEGVLRPLERSRGIRSPGHSTVRAEMLLLT